MLSISLVTLFFLYFFFQDIQYVDIDHMDERMDFTINDVDFPDLNQYFRSLQAGGMSTITILVIFI